MSPCAIGAQYNPVPRTERRFTLCSPLGDIPVSSILDGHALTEQLRAAWRYPHDQTHSMNKTVRRPAPDIGDDVIRLIGTRVKRTGRSVADSPALSITLATRLDAHAL